MGDQEVPWPALWGGFGGGEARDDDVPRVSGPRRWWAGPLDVEGLAVGAVVACGRAATALGRARGRVPCVMVDSADVAAAFDSFRHLRVDGREVVGFAPLSRFYATADSWVRFHANYAHHRRALLAALDVDPGLDDDTASVMVGAAARRERAEDLETRVRGAGGVAAALRTPQEWLAHEQGAAVASAPLVEERGGERPDGPVAPGGGGRALPDAGDGPMSGLRVLDLTRVIAGPTATRTLAALGADVLRVDPPGRPELLDQHLDTGFGKRSAEADLADPAVRSRLEELLEHADVLVSGYRPGALAGVGLGAEEVLGRHPHLVVAELSAWGWRGPWAHERGFDSIVQVASGIAHRYATSGPGGLRPGALPVQALDHAAGYLLAAAVMQALAHRAEHGGRAVRVSLARVAHELRGLPVPDGGARTLAVTTATVVSAYGPLVHVPPPLAVDGERLGYPGPPRPYGADDLIWR
ncbi:CoA transferase family III [Georgenia soli]|uniref:CoA transferase family III n=1 Tax=Georgenia soli TaxID=638953 RepID=A0A2A9EJC7_9MICO|nr:CoA transferase [Georgenia soli]PFG38631.1 CoA transferase family III [Georgenia soli]